MTPDPFKFLEALCAYAQDPLSTWAFRSEHASAGEMMPGDPRFGPLRAYLNGIEVGFPEQSTETYKRP